MRALDPVEASMATVRRGASVPGLGDVEAARAEWCGTVNALASRVRGWVEGHEWRTRLVSKPTRDPLLGRFEVPLLLMERNGVQIALNPVSRFLVTAEDGVEEGSVDLYVVPAYDEVASLYYDGETWTLFYVFDRTATDRRGRAEVMPLTAGSMLRVLESMTENAQ